MVTECPLHHDRSPRRSAETLRAQARPCFSECRTSIHSRLVEKIRPAGARVDGNWNGRKRRFERADHRPSKRITSVSPARYSLLLTPARGDYPCARGRIALQVQGAGHSSHIADLLPLGERTGSAAVSPPNIAVVAWSARPAPASGSPSSSTPHVREFPDRSGSDEDARPSCRATATFQLTSFFKRTGQ